MSFRKVHASYHACVHTQIKQKPESLWLEWNLMAIISTFIRCWLIKSWQRKTGASRVVIPGIVPSLPCIRPTELAAIEYFLACCWKGRWADLGAVQTFKRLHTTVKKEFVSVRFIHKEMWWHDLSDRRGFPRRIDKHPQTNENNGYCMKFQIIRLRQKLYYFFYVRRPLNVNNNVNNVILTYVDRTTRETRVFHLRWKHESHSSFTWFPHYNIAYFPSNSQLTSQGCSAKETPATPAVDVEPPWDLPW